MSKISKAVKLDVCQELLELPEMTGKDLRSWLQFTGLTQKDLAMIVGRGARQIRIYIQKQEEPIPSYIQLSCHYILMRMKMRERLKNASASAE